MEHSINALVLLPFFILLGFNCFTAESADCVYKIVVKTTDVDDAGTDSQISLQLYNNKHESVSVKDLESWGVMGHGHNYFEQNNVDVFVGTANCLSSPICGLVLKSDNSGNKPGWHVSYVEVNVYSNPPETIHFDINQWLAIDEYPHELTTNRNLCHHNKHMPLSFKNVA